MSQDKERTPARLLKDGQLFSLIVNSDEPYFAKVCGLVRDHAKARGEWTDDNEAAYREAYARWAATLRDDDNASKFLHRRLQTGAIDALLTTDDFSGIDNGCMLSAAREEILKLHNGCGFTADQQPVFLGMPIFVKEYDTHDSVCMTAATVVAFKLTCGSFVAGSPPPQPRCWLCVRVAEGHEWEVDAAECYSSLAAYLAVKQAAADQAGGNDVE